MREIPRYWRRRDVRLSLKGETVEWKNPGKFVFLGDRIFVINGEGKLVIPRDSQVREARTKILTLYEAAKVVESGNSK